MPWLRIHYAVRRYSQPGTFSAYLLAAVLAGIALMAPFPEGARLVWPVLATLAAALVCGTRAGLIALLVGAAGVSYIVSPLSPAMQSASASQISAVLVLMVVTGLSAIGLGSLRSVIDRSTGDARSLRMILATSPEAILLTDSHGNITRVNRRASEMFGMSAETLTGTPFPNLFPERLRTRLAASRTACESGSRLREMPSGLVASRGDGSEFPIEVRIERQESDGDVQGVALLRDLTEINAQRQTVAGPWPPGFGAPPHAAEEMRVWADAFTHAAVGLTITDPITRSLRFVNKAWAQMHGWSAEEALGMPTSLFFPEDELPRLPSLYTEADRTGHVNFEVRRLRKDGSTFLAAFDVVTVHDEDGVPLYRVASSRDITESRRAEELLRHATKMEAIGALTGGMAHDFNNLLGAIILSLDFVQTEMAGEDPFRPFVAEAKAAAESGAELIRNLLAFARRQSLHPSRVDVNDRVRGMYRLLTRVLGEEIHIVLECAADIWPVIADPSRLEACIMNLATNARDAMPDGGSLTITTGNQRLDADYVKLNPSVIPGDYAMIAVSDTGTGMTPEVVAKVFEPFFSTKDVGQGTGLGLSMVLGFATQSGGHVSVYSESGIGTTIRLFLPRTTRAAEPMPDHNETASVAPARGEGETVLVVEDNVAMRRVVTRQLAELNYNVLEATSAADALEMLESARVDLLFSDVVMPGGIDGFELAERLRARWASVKVLLTSGFSGDRVNARLGGLRSPPRLLGKPYDLEELARAVREALTR